MTKEELNTVNSLMGFRDNLIELIHSVKDECFGASAGITMHAGGSTHSQSKFFHQKLEKIRKPLNSVLLAMLENELKETNLEISKYIS